MTHPMKGKVALVTGAGKGIGRAIARMLAEEGASLMLNARTPSDLESLHAEIHREIDPQLPITLHPGSVADAAEVNRLVEATLHAYGRIDILINNAGVSPEFRLLQELSVADIDNTVDINLKGPLYLMKYVLPHMIHQQSGWIINLNSIAGKVAYAYSSVYCATKFGLHALTECVSQEQKQNNIRILGVYPGEVNTPIWQCIEPGVVQDPQKMMDAADIAEAVRYVLRQSEKVLVKDITMVPMYGTPH